MGRNLIYAIIIVAASSIILTACTSNKQETPENTDDQTEITDISAIEDKDNLENIKNPIKNNEILDESNKPDITENNNYHNTTDNWHHNGKEVVDKSKLPAIEYEISYYGYKNDYAKLYKLIPNISVNNNEDNTILKCVYCDTVSKADTKRALDLLTLDILKIPFEYIGIIEDEDYILYTIGNNSYNEQSNIFINSIVQELSEFKNDYINKIRIVNDNSEIHVYLNNKATEERSNDIVDLEIRSIVNLEIYNMIHFYSNEVNDETYKQKVKAFELDRNSAFLNSISYEIANYSDYNGVWTGFDDIGPDNFYPVLLDNIIVNRINDASIKIEMPTTIPGYTQEYLSKFYISLFEFLPTESSLYSNYQNTLYCYISDSEYNSIRELIINKETEFVENHSNIRNIENLENLYKFTVSDINLFDTSYDYYQYLTLMILDNKINVDKNIDNPYYKILVYNKDNILETIIKCSNESNTLSMVELKNIACGENSSYAYNFFTSLIENIETQANAEFSMTDEIVKILNNCNIDQANNTDIQLIFSIDYENTKVEDLVSIINYISPSKDKLIKLIDNKIYLIINESDFSELKENIDNTIKSLLNQSTFDDKMKGLLDSRTDIRGYRVLIELIESVNKNIEIDK